jgi:hypothetical protein
LVVVTTDSFQSAYRIFSILNDRGLALEPSDILKAETIGRIPEAKRATYTELWEDLEEQSGRKAFNELITHIRMIYRKEKARRSQLDEFKEHVVEKIPTAEALVDDVLKPYADAFEIIRNAAYESTHQADKVNRLLEWLLRITNQDWIPVAMYLVHKDDVDTERLIRHLIQLERLAASMFIRGIYVTPRIERFGKVLAAIAEGADLEASGSPLNLASEEVEATLRELDKPVYKFSAKLRSYILLRLDSLLADAGAIFQHSVTTIEHVLPQTVPTGSEWDQLWTQTDRQYWTDRIGNLVLLSRAKNSEAQNFSFTEKKQKYFTSKTGVCSFASTTQVLTYEHWSVQEVQDRQAQVLARFKAWLLV